MLALIVPVTLEKLPAINEKYDMAKALEDNVLQNYVKASTDAKQEKNPDEILQEKAGFEDDLRIELPDDSGRGAPEYIGGNRCPDADGLCKA